MENLPTEILRRVAGYTPFPTLQSLSRVSRRIRAAVLDWQVLRAITEKGVSAVGARLRDPRAAQWKRSPINGAMPLELCARYAWADSKARMIVDSMFWHDSQLVADFVRWGPVLVAQGHPLIEILAESQGSQAAYLYTSSPTDLYLISFCRTASTLTALASTSGIDAAGVSSPIPPMASDAELSLHWNLAMQGISNQNLFAGLHAPFEGTSVPRTREALDSLFQDISSIPNYPFGWEPSINAFSLQSLFVRTVSVLASRLHGTTAVFPGGQTTRRFNPKMLQAPPSGYDIPFTRFMQLPAPGADAAEFVWCHLDTMTSKEFIEEGQWIGMYTYGTMARMDPLMVDIKFRVVDPPAGGQEGNAQVLDVAASGIDGLNEFALYGKIYRATGKVVLTKAYLRDGENTLKWNWIAFMTPFGIVGGWGDPRWGGGIWLWKEDWRRGA
ncbi:hypothetical protein DRE_03022 [Drechslerella stenobrocha 248]|uniref:F-box domain-containing protein n=1 Tax=Drechslerella stenobrocha 248 TaxID=1043628 RepID=W7I5S7_9PEZI|nr:hypothetical protein DRE_03022 [Drechslerella stenobrocha 248]